MLKFLRKGSYESGSVKAKVLFSEVWYVFFKEESRQNQVFLVT